MRKIKQEKMKQEILKPKNLWIVDTRLCTLYKEADNTKAVYSEPKRKEVTVVYVGDFFIELASIPNNLKLSKCQILNIEPTQEYEEYADFKTLKQYPHEDWFDLENVTVESLKEMDTVRKIKKYLQQNSKNNS